MRENTANYPQCFAARAYSSTRVREEQRPENVELPPPQKSPVVDACATTLLRDYIEK